jgi:hypothetical protein
MKGMLRPLALPAASRGEGYNFFPRVKDGGLAVKDYLFLGETGQMAQYMQKMILL